MGKSRGKKSHGSLHALVGFWFFHFHIWCVTENLWLM